MLILVLIVSVFGTHELPTVVDVIELNVIHNDSGKVRFVQWILWDFEHEHGREHVVAWRVAKPCERVSRRGGEYSLDWAADRVIIGRCFRVRHSMEDLEVEDRAFRDEPFAPGTLLEKTMILLRDGSSIVGRISDRGELVSVAKTAAGAVVKSWFDSGVPCASRLALDTTSVRHSKKVVQPSDIFFVPAVLERAELLGLDVVNGSILKGFDPNQARDDHGRWVSEGAIQEAAGNPEAEKELRDRVTDPAQRAKLDAALNAADKGGNSTAEKKPWEMTQDEYEKGTGKPEKSYVRGVGFTPEYNAWSKKNDSHADVVLKAKLRGEKIPQNVIDSLPAGIKARMFPETVGEAPWQMSAEDFDREYVIHATNMPAPDSITFVEPRIGEFTRTMYEGSTDGESSVEDLGGKELAYFAKPSDLERVEHYATGVGVFPKHETPYILVSKRPGDALTVDENGTLVDDKGNPVERDVFATEPGDIVSEGGAEVAYAIPLDDYRKSGAKSVHEYLTMKHGGGAASPTAPAAVREWAREWFGSPSVADNFVKWFGDSAVVDDDGNPKEVYHGTGAGAGFDVFDLERSGENTNAGNTVLGFFFTDDMEIAEAGYSGRSGAIMPVFLSIKNPLKLVDSTGFDNDPGYELRKEASGYLGHSPETADDWKEWGEYLSRSGHDGIEYTSFTGYEGPNKRNTPQKTYIAFRPEQIKSSVGNKTFDPSNPSITKTFDPNQPRDDHGRWVSQGALEEARQDPEKAQELREKVTNPKEAAKLERELAGSVGGEGKPEDKLPSASGSVDELEAKLDKLETSGSTTGVLASKAEINVARQGLIRALQQKLKEMPAGTWDDPESKEIRGRLDELNHDDYQQNGTRAIAFKNWFGDWENSPEEASKAVDESGRPQKNVEYSQAVDENGEPVILYHGTTHEFNEFSDKLGNVENSFGIGHYFTTSMDDVNRNYASHDSPDLRSRIGMRTDELRDSVDEMSRQFKDELSDAQIDLTDGLSDDEAEKVTEFVESALDGLHPDVIERATNEVLNNMRDGYDYTAPSSNPFDAVAEDQARQELAGDNPRVIQAYLNVRNPIVLNGGGGTKFSVDYDYSSDDSEQVVSDMRDRFREKMIELKAPQETIDEILSEAKDAKNPDEFYNEIYRAFDLSHSDVGEASLSDATDDLADMATEWRDNAELNLSGTGRELADAIREVARDYSIDGYGEVDPEPMIEDIGLNEIDATVTADQVVQRIYQNLPGVLTQGEDNKAANGQFLQDVFRRLGYDGIKDMEVSKRFSGMRLSDDTTHWIVFDGAKIKAVDNAGTFDPTHLNIYKLSKRIPGAILKFSDDQPRDDNGRWVSAGAIAAAKLSPEKAGELRSKVTDPDERAKLDRSLGSSGPSLVDHYSNVVAEAAESPTMSAEQSAALRPEDRNQFDKPSNRFADSANQFPADRPVVKWAQEKFGDKKSAREFASWFRGSKAVDDSGNPEVLYHGSATEFNEFKPGTKNSWTDTLGFDTYFLTDNKSTASTYANQFEDGKVMSFAASLKNPLVIDANGGEWFDAIAEANDRIWTYRTDEEKKFLDVKDRIAKENPDDEELPPEAERQLREASRKLEQHILDNKELYANAERKPYGYDGIIVKNVMDSTAADVGEEFDSYSPYSNVYIAFNPDQFKRLPESGDASSSADHPVAKWAQEKFKSPQVAEKFVKWFGDSKVVKNVSGEMVPATVYHGSPSDFESFETAGNSVAESSGLGHWFSDSKEYASRIASTKTNEGVGANVKPVFLAIKNPKVYGLYSDLETALRGKTASELRSELESQGYDGIKIRTSTTDFSDIASIHWIAFDSKQIKSATGNTAFDPNDARLTKSWSMSATELMIGAFCREPVRFKSFDPNQPRDDNGRWVSSGAIAEAAANPKLAEKLRSQVTDPEQRAKLDRALEQKPEAAVDAPVDKASKIKEAHREVLSRAESIKFVEDKPPPEPVAVDPDEYTMTDREQDRFSEDTSDEEFDWVQSRAESELDDERESKRKELVEEYSRSPIEDMSDTEAVEQMEKFIDSTYTLSDEEREGVSNALKNFSTSNYGREAFDDVWEYMLTDSEMPSEFRDMLEKDRSDWDSEIDDLDNTDVDYDQVNSDLADWEESRLEQIRSNIFDSGDWYQSDRYAELRREWIRDNVESEEAESSAATADFGEWAKDSQDDWIYKFKINDGDKDRVFEVTCIDKKDRDATTLLSNLVQISEHAPEDESRKIAEKALEGTPPLHTATIMFADETGSFSVTGKGSAFKVFGEVMASTVALLRKENYDTIDLSAYEPSRQRLYDRMITSLASILPQYAAFTYQSHPTAPKTYVLVKRDHDKIVSFIKDAVTKDQGGKLKVLVKSFWMIGEKVRDWSNRSDWFRKMWDESDHPRANDGKFSSGGGGGDAKPVVPREARKFVSHIPSQFLNGLKVSVGETTHGEAQYNPTEREIRIHPDMLTHELYASDEEAKRRYDKTGRDVISSPSFASTYGLPETGNVRDQYVRHLLSHEIGHHVWESMDDSQREKAAKLLEGVSTPTVGAYVEHRDERLANATHEAETEYVNHMMAGKLTRERFAEAFRQHIMEGKHRRAFSSIFKRKMWTETEHPRDDHGRFVSSGDISLAAHNTAEADKLRASVTDPEERAKLDKAIDNAKSDQQAGGGDATAGEADAGSIRGSGELRGGAAELEQSRVAATVDRPALAGLPTKVKIPGVGEVVAGPFKPARQAAEDYMRSAGLSYDPPKTYAKVDKERATRIAQAYSDMKHDPNDPQVKAAYRAMIDETLAQWEAIKKTGLKVEFIDIEKTGDPYAASPRLATEDVIKNNHLWVFPTSSGFGSDQSFDPSTNPLLEMTNETISGKPTCANDIFRIVHDYFGHIKEGVGFRADGEENAWRSHSAMYSPLARWAMTSETRGQNSWVNFGPNAEKNKTANAAETIYADQKTGLLPRWVVDEGAGDAPKIEPMEATNEWHEVFSDGAKSLEQSSAPSQQKIVGAVLRSALRSLALDHPSLEAIEKNDPTKAQELRAAFTAATESIPPKALATIGARLKSIQFYPDADEVTVKFFQTVNDELKIVPPGNPQKLREVALNGPTRQVGLCIWSPDGSGNSEVHLDGPALMPEGLTSEERAYFAAETHAHELAHALDGNGPNKVSANDEWVQAWHDEIGKSNTYGVSGRLSDYATKSKSEGWAEFGRLVWLHPEVAKQDFPKCFKFWHERGFA